MKNANVLLICVDQWPGRLMRVAGHPAILTPTLDHLCANGIRFSEAYSSTPTCIPARRELMTGTSARTHGDRSFTETLRMDPALPTLPQIFGNAGYQTCAVGKLHVYPQRSRIGFDEVILNEEGRHHLGLMRDDYELSLLDAGYAGQELTHAMGNNNYTVRPWHLPEELHQTNWTTKQMCRSIQRRDPDRPAFWFCSYAAPHPPIVPPAEYLAMYDNLNVDDPHNGQWSERFDNLPFALKVRKDSWPYLVDKDYIRIARQGFYAQCTYVDHQIRLLIGTLREEGLLEDTIVMFIGDHGDMLGNHRQWAKPTMYECAVKIPMILVPNASSKHNMHHVTDDRLCGLCDVMPTLLWMCNIPMPETVEGISLISEQRRQSLYCEHYEDDSAMRMVRMGKYKLIYYPTGNHLQLFDLESDPKEMIDLARDAAFGQVRNQLIETLISNLYGSDVEWLRGGELIGLPDKEYIPAPDYGLRAQRGWRT